MKKKKFYFKSSGKNNNSVRLYVIYILFNSRNHKIVDGPFVTWIFAGFNWYFYNHTFDRKKGVYHPVLLHMHILSDSVDLVCTFSGTGTGMGLNMNLQIASRKPSLWLARRCTWLLWRIWRENYFTVILFLIYPLLYIMILNYFYVPWNVIITTPNKFYLYIWYITKLINTGNYIVLS